MKDKLDFIRLPIVLIVLFFAGRLVMGAAGAGYDAGNRVFSMVILETHLAFLWGALGRRYGYGVGDALLIGLLIGLVTQVLVFGGTVVSDLAGVETYFNDPIAVTGTSSEPIGTGEAALLRLGGLVGNSIFAAILSAIGWTAGNLMPKPGRIA